MPKSSLISTYNSAEFSQWILRKPYFNLLKVTQGHGAPKLKTNFRKGTCKNNPDNAPPQKWTKAKPAVRGDGGFISLFCHNKCFTIYMYVQTHVYVSSVYHTIYLRACLFYTKIISPSVLAFTYNLSHEWQRQEDHHEFQASLSYIESSRPAWTTQRKRFVSPKKSRTSKQQTKSFNLKNIPTWIINKSSFLTWGHQPEVMLKISVLETWSLLFPFLDYFNITNISILIYIE